MFFVKSLRLPTLALCVLCMHCTREPAPSERAVELTLPPAPWAQDSAYIVWNEEPGLLIGFDLYEKEMDAPSIKVVVDQLKANGGNYLSVNKTLLDSAGTARELGRAVNQSIYVDTARNKPAATRVAGSRLFQASLLDGHGRLALEQFTQAGLNAIRAARTVERHLPFHTIFKSEEILSENNPTGARSGTDGQGNYLIYIPTSGRVNLKLGDDRQGARRVTVVGHMGTQRSEVLRPPYDSTFTLLSNDEHGGWMIVELLGE